MTDKKKTKKLEKDIKKAQKELTKLQEMFGQQSDKSGLECRKKIIAKTNYLKELAALLDQQKEEEE